MGGDLVGLGGGRNGGKSDSGGGGKQVTHGVPPIWFGNATSPRNGWEDRGGAGLIIVPGALRRCRAAGLHSAGLGAEAAGWQEACCLPAATAERAEIIETQRADQACHADPVRPGAARSRYPAAARHSFHDQEHL